MVSFFGIRFGGDKKKQQKQAEKKQQQQQQQQQQQGDPNTLGEDQLTADHDLPQPPQRRLSRPGTHDPAEGRNIDLRRTLSDLPAASSMMDLSSPSSRRQPSLGSMSQLIAGDGSSRPKHSPTSLMLPQHFGNSAPRHGTSSRPSSSQMSKWVDPLDVHFGRSISAEGAASSHDVIAKSPLDQIKFDVRDLVVRGGIAADTDKDILDQDGGYPSPPSSPKFGSELRATMSSTSHGRRGPAPLPSPVPSASLFCDDKEEIPVIRNVQAKRDTLTFISPRRRSFTMEIEGANKDKKVETNEAAGLSSGSDSLRGSLDKGLVESPTEMAAPHPFKESLETTREGVQSQQSPPEVPRAAQPVMPHPNAGLFNREAPRGFNSRKRSDHRAPQPLTIATSTNLLSTNASASERPMPSPLASKTPMEGQFPVSKGLPRGRLPTLQSQSAEISTVEAEDGFNIYSVPALEVDPSEPRRSAMPAPLFPVSSQDPSRPSTMAPLVSPTFSNVENVLSRDTLELARSFELSLDITEHSPIDCDFGDFLKE